jgi:hypothetical protein
MTSLDQEGKPAAAPLDAERERLRKAGYTDAEVSQILIAREAASHASEPTGHGVMTGVASNLTAAAGYVRNFVPSIIADFMTLKNQAATPTARGQAAGYLVMKAAVIFVIAYVVWQEFSQLRSVTARAQAEACIARQKLIIDTMPAVGLSGNTNTNTPYYQEWRRRHDEFDRDCVGSP